MSSAVVIPLLGGFFVCITCCAMVCHVSRVLTRAVSMPARFGLPAPPSSPQPPPPPPHRVVKSPGGVVCLAQRV